MDDIGAAMRDARGRSLELLLDLDDAAWLGPRLAIVNPPLWELAHVGWFQEFWVLRRGCGRAPRIPRADALYDSARVPHDVRWELPLLPRAEVLAYLDAVLDDALALSPGYFHELALFHEDMHGEAFASTRQTLGYPAPAFALAEQRPAPAGAWPGDAEVPGGRYELGARPDDGFVFDNEKWAHPVDVAAFRIARSPVTNAEFAAFVDAGGYRDRSLWSTEGWSSVRESDAEMPVYWRRDERGTLCHRRNDRVEQLAPNEPVVHVSWFEAEAFCRFAGRRLPTEVEWELAASGFDKRRFPWGDEPPGADHANVDGRARRPVDVAAHAAGDSPFGCRQMIGNVWEWTASDFAPYPGFVVDPYKEYSEPWFHTPHKVLRGGAWITRGRLLRNTWRNFYPPRRRDVLAGFRTCALR
jgi:iron(II)-dependent oxidoreductase